MPTLVTTCANVYRSVQPSVVMRCPFAGMMTVRPMPEARNPYFMRIVASFTVFRVSTALDARRHRIEKGLPLSGGSDTPDNRK